jgi:hypothetical protein
LILGTLPEEREPAVTEAEEPDTTGEEKSEDEDWIIL